MHIGEENTELRRWIKHLARTAELAVPAIDKLMRLQAAKRGSMATPVVGVNDCILSLVLPQSQRATL